MLWLDVRYCVADGAIDIECPNALESYVLGDLVVVSISVHPCALNRLTWTCCDCTETSILMCSSRGEVTVVGFV